MTAKLKLYDNPASIHAQYARVVLDEAGIEYEKEHVDLPLGNLEPSYAKVSAALSVPALEIVASTSSDTTTLTDSRDIIDYCATAEGGERLFPKENADEIDEILDLIYAANGGQISFKSYPPRDRLFDFAINKIMAPLRGRKLRGYLADQDIVGSPRMKKIYDDALERLGKPGPSLEELSERASEAMAALDERLENGPWLLGEHHTAADCVASIWVQWIVWADPPSITVTPRVLDFLERSKERPAWEKTEPQWVISFIRKRLYVGASLMGGASVGVACLLPGATLVGCAVAGVAYLVANRNRE